MDPIVEKLTTARISLLLRQPFFGNMATRLRLEDASNWLDTAATDGRHLYFNRDFVEKLSIKKLEFLLCHEILHLAFDHLGRTGSRHKTLSNIAQDFAINQILVDDRIGDRITEVKICQDNKYRGMSWEEIYDKLWDEADKIDMSQFIKGLGELLDEHLDGQGDDGKDGDEEGKGRPRISKEEMQRIRDEVKEAMIQAASAAGAGNMPAGVERLIKQLTEPKMDWREVLRTNIQSTLKGDFSFTRPSRKGWQFGVFLPGMLPEEAVEVAIAIDTSGSISDKDVCDFLTEIKGLMDQYASYKIDLWTFDTRVYNHVTITQDNAQDLLTYDVQGGGGTSFQVNWDFMKDNDMNPKRFIMFTDLCSFDGFGDPDYVETIFLVKGNQKAVAPHGLTLHYEKLT